MSYTTRFRANLAEQHIKCANACLKLFDVYEYRFNFNSDRASMYLNEREPDFERRRIMLNLAENAIFLAAGYKCRMDNELADMKRHIKYAEELNW